MKKIIKITESDLRNIIKEVIFNTYNEEENAPEEYSGNSPYTMSNWKHDKTLDNLKPGMDVTREVIDDLLNSVPPTTYKRTCFQPGEPYTVVKGQSAYQTFAQNADGTWKYIGLCAAGQNKPL